MLYSLPSLRELPVAVRALFTCFLVTIGFGYIAAVAYLFLTDVDPHRRMGMSVAEGITMKYYGSGRQTRLEAALSGAMMDKASAGERERLLEWVRAGATAETYPDVSPIVERNCLACHGPSGLAASLATYEAIRKYAQPDRGPGFAMLARVSHVHLFGISIIFLLTGGIFALSAISPAVRVLAIVVPFVAIWADIGSWWLTRYLPVFAYVVLSGGAVMGISLGVQILASLWEMWLQRPSLARRSGSP